MSSKFSITLAFRPNGRSNWVKLAPRTAERFLAAEWRKPWWRCTSLKHTPRPSRLRCLITRSVATKPKALNTMAFKHGPVVLSIEKHLLSAVSIALIRFALRICMTSSDLVCVQLCVRKRLYYTRTNRVLRRRCVRIDTRPSGYQANRICRVRPLEVDVSSFSSKFTCMVQSAIKVELC